MKGSRNPGRSNICNAPPGCSAESFIFRPKQRMNSPAGQAVR
jgi:hypothetical protein